MDITLNLAKDLKDLNLFSKMDLYVVVSIHDDYFNNNNNANQQRTHIDKDCSPNPKWDFPMKFTVDVSAVEQNLLALVMKIKAEKKLTSDKEVGEAHVPIKESSSRATVNNRRTRDAQATALEPRKLKVPNPVKKKKKKRKCDWLTT